MKRLAAPIVAAVALAGLATGCDAGAEEDFDNGRSLFIESCGRCHALDEAATAEGVGPDLDAAFADARASGMDSDTIEGVVESQISNPRQTSPENTQVYMPADLVTGDDAADVAHYVGRVAGVPGIEPPQVECAEGVKCGLGAQVFANNGCASCHTLEAIPSAIGTSGPNLTETLQGQTPEEIEESIVEPDAEIVQGFDDLMPDNYGEDIPPDDLEALIDFLGQDAGGASGGGGGSGGGSGSGGS
jgi:mono/diheme cytochrome c family protein